MGFLQQFLNKKRISIQCHNNPDSDTLASGYCLYRFFSEYGVDTELIYGGRNKIKRFDVCYMVEHCGIPIRHVKESPQTDLLLVVDGQYGEGNVELFQAPEIAMIDHHIRVTPESPASLIKSEYQSCSTIIWELLVEEGYPVEQDEKMCVALLYGLYVDTSSFCELYRKKDMEMRMALSGNHPHFEKLTKSCMTVAELMIASDAMQNHFFSPEKRYAIVPAIDCEQSVLGIIGDFMIQVDVVLLSVVYIETFGGYRISVRSCDDEIAANEITRSICQGTGSGGGHSKKAGGWVSAGQFRETYGDMDFFDFLVEKLDALLPDSRLRQSASENSPQS